jgi:Fur family peroxide stress response transcriptional regulator
MVNTADKSKASEDAAGLLRRALEQSGWRCTRQRSAVHEYLCSVECHPTAEEVFAAVRRHIPNISLATVYKALEALVDARLAFKLTGGDGPARYDSRTDAHYHLCCLKSGRIIDLPTTFDAQLLDKLDPNLASKLRRQGFRVSGYRLEVLGTFE